MSDVMAQQEQTNVNQAADSQLHQEWVQQAQQQAPDPVQQQIMEQVQNKQYENSMKQAEQWSATDFIRNNIKPKVEAQQNVIDPEIRTLIAQSSIWNPQKWVEMYNQVQKLMEGKFMQNDIKTMMFWQEMQQQFENKTNQWVFENKAVEKQIKIWDEEVKPEDIEKILKYFEENIPWFNWEGEANKSNADEVQQWGSWEQTWQWEASDQSSNVEAPAASQQWDQNQPTPAISEEVLKAFWTLRGQNITLSSENQQLQGTLAQLQQEVRNLNQQLGTSTQLAPEESQLFSKLRNYVWSPNNSVLRDQAFTEMATNMEAGFGIPKSDLEELYIKYITKTSNNPLAGKKNLTMADFMKLSVNKKKQ